MIVYKAVRRINGNFHSLYAKALGFDLMYRIGHRTVPMEPSKLFAFADMERAEEFRVECSDLGDTHVLEGNTRHADINNSRLIWNIGMSTDELINYWLGKKAGYCKMPSGTVLIPDFTPIYVCDDDQD